jgi:tripartite-type tricarboxylate transporter receptor subunit TctC
MTKATDGGAGWTRRGALAGAAGLLAAAPLRPARAQAGGAGAAWPSRPVRVVVAWPPGGGADTPIRLGAPVMQGVLGQPVVIENRPGASGSVGAGVVAQAAPDGYTVLADTAAISVNHLLIPGLPYDAATALVPVSLIARSPLLLVVRADHPARSLQDLIGRMRAAPGRVPFGHSGTGTVTQLAPVRLFARARVEANGVAYRGGAASIAGLLAGDVECVFSTLPQSAPQVQEGRLRGLAVSIGQRLANLPDIPTVAEQGFPGFDLADWLGMFVPAGTPAPVVARLAEAAQAAMRDAEVVRRMGGIGMLPRGGTPAEFAAFLAGQRTTLGDIIRENNIRAE